MSKRLTWMLLSLLLSVSGVTLSGCVEIPKIPGAEKIPGLEWLGEKPADPHGAQAEAEGGITGDNADEGAAEEGTDASALLPPEMRNLPYEELELITSDKIKLYGRLYDPSQKGDEDEVAAESDTVTKYPLVVLVHGLNRSQLAWSAMPAALVKAGYAVVAVDLRGHGKSTQTVGRRAVAWRLFQEKDWGRLPKDVSQVIRYFQASEDYPQVDGTRVALFGEGLGANAAMIASRQDSKSVKALVLMSPGMNYKGLAPSQDYVDYPQPALIMASSQDEYSYDSAQKLYRWFVGPRKLELYQQQIGIGSEILVHQPFLKDSVVDWLVKQFPPTPITAPVAEEESADEV